MRLAIFLLLVPFALQAQTFRVTDQIDMEVLGTSTLHDWEMVSEEGTGTATFSVEDGILKDITKLQFSMKTRTLKSGKGAMDKICYEAMKEEDHKEIVFNLSDLSNITKTGTDYTIKAKGYLKIAGKSNPVTIPVKAKFTDDKVVFTGEYDLKMTQYKIEPPTAMFGTIKTGDDIKVKFTVTYSSTSNF